MIARLQRWLLVAQFVLGTGLAAWLAGTGRSSIGAAVAIGIVAPIALHAVVLTADFAIAWLARGTRPEDASRHGFVRGLRAWTVAWAREIGCAVQETIRGSMRIASDSARSSAISAPRSGIGSAKAAVATGSGAASGSVRRSSPSKTPWRSTVCAQRSATAAARARPSADRSALAQ